MFILWKPPHRGMRLTTHALIKRLMPAEMAVIDRVVAGMTEPAALVSWLKRHRAGAASVDRYREEHYLLALEDRRKELGLSKLPDPALLDFRKEGLGLGAESALMIIFEQCAARWHTRNPPDIPRSVKLMLTGAQNLGAIEEDVAVLLEEDAHLRRRKALPVEKHPKLRAEIVRQWVTASGGLQQHLDVVDRMLGQDKDHHLADLAAAGGYAKLAAGMVDLARQVAHEVAPGDARLAYYTYRVLQRVAACTVEGEAMWKATWLRGEKTDPQAIPGTSSRQNELWTILRTRIFDEEPAKGHSGAAAIPTTFRLRVRIDRGTCGHEHAAQVLGIQLNSKGMPRRGG
jgi:hypothetical protein